MIEKLLSTLLKNKLLISSLLVIATVGILFLTLIPSQHLGESSLYQYDKAGHFALFFLWTLVFGFYSFSKKRSNASLVIIFVISSCFGIGIEVMQELLPYGRNGNIYDALADIAGSFTAVLFLYYIKNKYLPEILP